MPSVLEWVLYSIIGVAAITYIAISIWEIKTGKKWKNRKKKKEDQDDDD